MSKGILERLSEGGSARRRRLSSRALPRIPMGEFALRARDMGYNFIGSCCGSVAVHVRDMAKALGKVSGAEREWRTTTGKAQSGYELHRMNSE